MYPLAAAACLRFVAVNRRGYPGSTPYSADEQALLESDDPKSHAVFRRKQGLAIAHAVLEILDDPKLALPAAEGVKLGVLGYSTGTWFVLALLAVLDDPELLPAERAKLAARVTHPILLGSSQLSRCHARMRELTPSLGRAAHEPHGGARAPERVLSHGRGPACG